MEEIPALAALALHWLNPLAWLATRRQVFERELAAELRSLHLERVVALRDGDEARAATLAEDKNVWGLYETFLSQPMFVLVRFGMWEELLAEPQPEDAELFSFTTALLHYGRTVALANLVMAAVAHVETEHVGAGLEHPPDLSLAAFCHRDRDERV